MHEADWRHAAAGGGCICRAIGAMLVRVSTDPRLPWEVWRLPTSSVSSNSRLRFFPRRSGVKHRVVRAMARVVWRGAPSSRTQDAGPSSGVNFERVLSCGCLMNVQQPVLAHTGTWMYLDARVPNAANRAIKLQYTRSCLPVLSGDVIGTTIFAGGSCTACAVEIPPTSIGGLFLVSCQIFDVACTKDAHVLWMSWLLTVFRLPSSLASYTGSHWWAHVARSARCTAPLERQGSRCGTLLGWCHRWQEGLFPLHHTFTATSPLASRQEQRIDGGL